MCTWECRKIQAQGEKEKEGGRCDQKIYIPAHRYQTPELKQASDTHSHLQAPHWRVPARRIQRPATAGSEVSLSSLLVAGWFESGSFHELFSCSKKTAQLCEDSAQVVAGRESMVSDHARVESPSRHGDETDAPLFSFSAWYSSYVVFCFEVDDGLILRVDDVYVLTGYCLIGVVNVHACVGSHSGWLKIYHFGVAKALQEGQLVDRAKFVGSSAGSLICLALALGLDFDRIRE